MRKLLLLGGAAGALSIAVLLALSPAASARDPGAGPNFAAGHAYAAVPPGSHHGLKRGTMDVRPDGVKAVKPVGIAGSVPEGAYRRVSVKQLPGSIAPLLHSDHHAP
jgi:hypothetical protein